MISIMACRDVNYVCQLSLLHSSFLYLLNKLLNNSEYFWPSLWRTWSFFITLEAFKMFKMIWKLRMQCYDTCFLSHSIKIICFWKMTWLSNRTLTPQLFLWVHGIWYMLLWSSRIYVKSIEPTLGFGIFYIKFTCIPWVEQE